ncbi:hypothetical protein RJT34_33295 [Clitoria ternatea]|uniref:Uncharacterized protein n=1 Tax=Clitoria ternatea TaxID=43366 RepID=A0AAN9I4I3_CLITE
MAAMDAVSFQVKDHGWGAQSLLNSWHPMYAFGECHRDLNHTQCDTCFTQARQLLSRCVPNTEGRIYLDRCFLRYDNYSFFRESVDTTHDINVCETKRGDEEFAQRAASVIVNVTSVAAARGFAADGEGGVYALAQCWRTVNKWNCEKCVNEAGKKVQECLPSTEGRTLLTGCFLRYSSRKFYNDIVVTQNEERNDPKPNRGINPCDASPSLRYRYDLLENATNYFDPSNKLGQGNGPGSVFKGTLPSGKTVAVKRLFLNSRHGTDEFFNEVNLINGIQHKNVVKLLGYSIEGPESLLIYEYVPNKSLDQVLFAVVDYCLHQFDHFPWIRDCGRDSKNTLTWEQRFQIICGIAESLTYLHEGFGKMIIHRDIKSSNIMLDENLNPKIADFGIDRCVAESHLSTETTETLGYMAPEYLTKGQMTEKADIYSFGVLAVEIVCGKRNSAYIPGSTSLLQSVWKNYKAGNILASIDPALHGKLKIEEASNALQVGLLCTQCSVTLRPSMSEVVQMLTKKDFIIPSPMEQPFIHSTVLILDDSLTSTSARSSFHSTTSFLIPGDDLLVLEKSLSSSEPR